MHIWVRVSLWGRRPALVTVVSWGARVFQLTPRSVPTRPSTRLAPSVRRGTPPIKGALPERPLVVPRTLGFATGPKRQSGVTALPSSRRAPRAAERGRAPRGASDARVINRSVWCCRVLGRRACRGVAELLPVWTTAAEPVGGAGSAPPPWGDAPPDGSLGNELLGGSLRRPPLTRHPRRFSFFKPPLGAAASTPPPPKWRTPPLPIPAPIPARGRPWSSPFLPSSAPAPSGIRRRP